MEEVEGVVAGEHAGVSSLSVSQGRALKNTLLLKENVQRFEHDGEGREDGFEL